VQLPVNKKRHGAREPGKIMSQVGKKKKGHRGSNTMLTGEAGEAVRIPNQLDNSQGERLQE